MYAKYQNVSVKALVQVDFPGYALSMQHLELQRPITLTELAPSPYFFIIKEHLIIDINVSAKFDEIPSMPCQGIKKPSIMEGQTDRKMDGWTT